MRRLEHSTRQRLDHWELTLRAALEQTQLVEEKRRLEVELSELGQVRAELESMEDAQMEQVHDRLGRDPSEWVAHKAEPAEPVQA
jgi:hypothetical protein